MKALTASFNLKYDKLGNLVFEPKEKQPEGILESLSKAVKGKVISKKYVSNQKPNSSLRLPAKKAKLDQAVKVSLNNKTSIIQNKFLFQNYKSLETFKLAQKQTA